MNNNSIFPKLMIFAEFKWRQQTWYTNWPQFMLRWFFWLSEFREFSKFKKISRIRIEFSLNRDAFCRFYRITRKEKNPVAKCYPHREVNSGPLTVLPCMLIFELIPLFAWSLRPSDPHMVMLEWKVTLSRYIKSPIGTQKEIKCNNTQAKNIDAGPL